jgi:hypothetical protein
LGVDQTAGPVLTEDCAELFEARKGRTIPIFVDYITNPQFLSWSKPIPTVIDLTNLASVKGRQGLAVESFLSENLVDFSGGLHSSVFLDTASESHYTERRTFKGSRCSGSYCLTNSPLAGGDFAFLGTSDLSAG